MPWSTPLPSFRVSIILYSLQSTNGLTQPLSGLVQLRFRVTDRAAQKVCNFAMSIPLDIMQDKNLAKTRGQALDAAFKIYSVDRALEDSVGRPKFEAPWWGGFIVGIGNRFDRDYWELLFAQTHQHEVYRQPVQPG